MQRLLPPPPTLPLSILSCLYSLHHLASNELAALRGVGNAVSCSAAIYMFWKMYRLLTCLLVVLLSCLLIVASIGFFTSQLRGLSCLHRTSPPRPPSLCLNSMCCSLTYTSFLYIVCKTMSHTPPTYQAHPLPHSPLAVLLFSTPPSPPSPPQIPTQHLPSYSCQFCRLPCVL